MPRTSVVESPGCPPLRVLTTDVLGLVKVVEARANDNVPKVVNTWGPPDASRGIITSSFADHESQPIIAVARKNNLVEILNPLNGNSLVAMGVGELSSSEHPVEDDPIVGLHLLKTKSTELPCRLNVLLMCTEKGKASMKSISMDDASHGSSNTESQSTWDVCAAGKLICSSVDSSEKYALFGGKGIEMNIWDLDKCCKTWTSKFPRSNSLGIFTPTWFTAASFLSKEDHRKIVAGTSKHQVRFYDISAQRRPVTTVNFRESPIKAVTAGLDGHTVYVGTGCGDLASFDMRTGKLLGCFVGKCCGSIRSIARHPELPILASCGLDRYLRIWDTKTRQLLSAVFLKQHLTNVMIDSHFKDEECAGNPAENSDIQAVEQIEAHPNENDDELLISETKISKKKDKNKALNTEKSKGLSENPTTEDEILSLSEDEDDKKPALKRRKKSSEGKGRSKKIKNSKSKKSSNKN